ncbi:MAG: ABC transporter permease [Clostridia bacterium]|nr:ABC transporter permease [Clostridia bacterium]
MLKKMKELYIYRQFLKTSVKKEFRGKYKKSFFGVLWSFINPLLQLLIYALVFPFILKIQEDNYVMFLFSALIPWNFFATTISQSTSVVVGNGGILKKVYFPREILPISIVISGAINFLISCIIIFVALIISGIGITANILWLPVILLVQCIITLAICFILSALTVYIRDLEYFINVLLQLWMYITPVLYTMSLIPAKFAKFFVLNPMVEIINAYRNIFYYQTAPNLKALLILAGVGIVGLLIGYAIFKKLEKRFAEEL